MRRLFAVLTCASLLVPGCASSGTPRVQAPESPVDRGLLAAYVRQLPIGSHVRVALTDGHSIKGTLMETNDTTLVVQRRTRVPEPPDEVALANVTAVELDASTGERCPCDLGWRRGWRRRRACRVSHSRGNLRG